MIKKTKVKKIFISFAVLLILLNTTAFLYASSVIDDPIQISFQDSNLYDAIKLYFEAKNMKYSANDSTLTITASEQELNQVEELNLKGTDSSKIVNTTGLNSFVNLKKLNLADNNITDITPIAQLTNLISIDFSNNKNINLYNKNDNTCYLPNQANLEELYISSTNNSDISFVNKLPNLKVLNISNNGISVLTKLRTLSKLEILDVSNNTPITTIDDILNVSTLKELNIATTGITDLLHSDYQDEEYEHGIFDLTNLEILNVENNKLSIEPVYRTYTNDEDEEEVYLKKLKKLNFNYTKQNNIDYFGLSQLQNLTHLYMKGNEINYISEDISTLPNLEYINLSENNIEDISGFIKYDYEGNIEDVLTAKEIILEHNRIEDISTLAQINHDITYLDLSSNLIFSTVEAIDFGKFSFSKGIDLTRQGRDKYDYENEEERWAMKIKQKAAKINQYIILPTLFQNSKNSNSIVYDGNVTFSYKGIELNQGEKYNTPGCYNVIIPPPEDNETWDQNEQQIFSITLNGGCADGSLLYFEYVDDYDATDSLMFVDVNLATAIENELMSKITPDNRDEYYVAKAHDILNISNSLISDTTILHLEEKNISDLTGLASFENLTHVYLSNNNLSSLDELRYNEYMNELYVANNPNIGNNNTAIQNMTYLVKLDLSNTGMTNIVSLQNLIQKWQEYESYTTTYLNLSNNLLENIQNIGLIVSLEELYLSNIGIEDLTELSTLTNLKTLNLSGNEIKKIDNLRTLTKLKYLTISNNQIEDITPISQISLDSLDFSNNKVKDVSSLSKSYTTIKMDTNQISDITNFENRLIENFSATNQKISQGVDTLEDEFIIIDLPPIFKASRKPTSKVYSENNFITTNCELSTDGNSVVLKPGDLGEKIATVKINGGKAHLTTFSMAAPLKGTITYNPSNEVKTNQNVTATITFNRSNVTITNNKGKNTYTFTDNGEFTFKYIDESGFEGMETATVNNIDKIAPKAIEIKKEIVNKKVVVTIKVNEPILGIEGWTLAEDKLSITRTYEIDANEDVDLSDEAGNVTTVNVKVKIDTVAPIITGVVDGEKYNKPVTPSVTDDNLDTVILTKDGTLVSNYQIGTEIKGAGVYELIATDKFENTTKVSFEVEISDVVISTKLTVTEDKLLIRDINPKTAIKDLENLLQAEMTYEILDTKGNVVSTTAMIGTGFKIKMSTGKTYTLIVRGDLNGDGQIAVQELAAASRINSDPVNTINELQLLAIDVSKNGKVEIADLGVLSKLQVNQ